MQFKVAKYSEGDACEFVEDADLQVVFRARRATSPAQPAPVQERNFCERCGKRLGSGIHTCTPPAAPVQEPVAWKWHQAPVKTSWGDGMVVADLAIDKDHTVSVYCERDQTAKVEAMLTPPAAQRQWVGLAEEDKHKPDMGAYVYLNDDWLDGYKTGMEYAEAKLKEKNT